MQDGFHQGLNISGMHIAIIMDGNGRWATRQGLPRIAGHRAGVAAVRRVVERSLDHSVRCLTLYAFSSDNWKRPAPEVRSIFWLLRAFLRLESARLLERGVRIQIIGRRDRLTPPVLREIEKAEILTARADRLELRVAIDYSSRETILRAAVDASRAWARTGMAGAGSASPDLDSMLNAALGEDSGNVDLLIRTGGEKRLSDFLLWESAYAELFFTDCMWPDFKEADLDSAIADFRRRERRFGGAAPVPRESALDRPFEISLS